MSDSFQSTVTSTWAYAAGQCCFASELRDAFCRPSSHSQISRPWNYLKVKVAGDRHVK